MADLPQRRLISQLLADLMMADLELFCLCGWSIQKCWLITLWVCQNPVINQWDQPTLGWSASSADICRYHPDQPAFFVYISHTAPDKPSIGQTGRSASRLAVSRSITDQLSNQLSTADSTYPNFCKLR